LKNVCATRLWAEANQPFYSIIIIILITIMTDNLHHSLYQLSVEKRPRDAATTTHHSIGTDASPEQAFKRLKVSSSTSPVSIPQDLFSSDSEAQHGTPPNAASSSPPDGTTRSVSYETEQWPLAPSLAAWDGGAGSYPSVESTRASHKREYDSENDDDDDDVHDSFRQRPLSSHVSPLHSQSFDRHTTLATTPYSSTPAAVPTAQPLQGNEYRSVNSILGRLHSERRLRELQQQQQQQRGSQTPFASHVPLPPVSQGRSSTTSPKRAAMDDPMDVRTPPTKQRRAVKHLVTHSNLGGF
jgi:hypothetical protein